MIVHWWHKPSWKCDACRKFKESGVEDHLRMVFAGITDVSFIPRRLNQVDRKMASFNGEKIEKSTLFINPVVDIEEMADGPRDLATPGMFLEYRDANEIVDPMEFLDTQQEVDQVLGNTPEIVSRVLVRRCFRFYLDHVVDVPPPVAMEMRKPRHPEKPERKEPRREYGEFKINEWQQAFHQAQTIEY